MTREDELTSGNMALIEKIFEIRMVQTYHNRQQCKTETIGRSNLRLMRTRKSLTRFALGLGEEMAVMKTVSDMDNALLEDGTFLKRLWRVFGRKILVG